MGVFSPHKQGGSPATKHCSFSTGVEMTKTGTIFNTIKMKLKKEQIKKCRDCGCLIGGQKNRAMCGECARKSGNACARTKRKEQPKKEEEYKKPLAIFLEEMGLLEHQHCDNICGHKEYEKAIIEGVYSHVEIALKTQREKFIREVEGLGKKAKKGGEYGLELSDPDYYLALEEVLSILNKS